MIKQLDDYLAERGVSRKEEEQMISESEGTIKTAEEIEAGLDAMIGVLASYIREHTNDWDARRYALMKLDEAKMWATIGIPLPTREDE